jgi:glycosyltransferase involved in cell wall biosynthesis
MRILLVNKFLYPKGGAERAVLTIGATLERRGHTVHYFGMDHPENSVPAAAVDLVRRRDYHRPGAWRDATAMLYSVEARRRFARCLARVRPQIVHAHNVYHQLTPSILDAARDRGVPVVMTLHDYKLVCPRYDMLRRERPCDACVESGPTACLRHRCARGAFLPSLWLALESTLHRVRGSYDAVGKFLVPSRFLAAVLLRAGFDPARIRHVPNFAPVLPPGPGEPHADRYVFAGRLSPEKGVETLVRAALRLGRGRLVVCGDGPTRARLEALAGAHPGRIEFRGHLDAAQLAVELRSAALVAVPSEWFENAPFAVLEAMALGRAVLASRLGGLPELVADGETGELLPAGDVDAWAQALGRAVGDPERTRRWGDAAGRRAAARFGLEEHVRALEATYAEAAG